MTSPRYVAWANPSAVANTAETSPLSENLPIATAWLWTFEVRIPPGHAGLTGIALVDSGQVVLPYATSGTAWLIGDDDLLSYDYDKQLGENVQLLFYNSDDTYNHAWQVRLAYTPMSAYVADDSFLVTPEPAAWLGEVAADGL